MQNEPNLLETQMNATSFTTMHYENKQLSRRRENEPNTNPIYTKQTQFKTLPWRPHTLKTMLFNRINSSHRGNDILSFPRHAAKHKAAKRIRLPSHSRTHPVIPATRSEAKSLERKPGIQFVNRFNSVSALRHPQADTGGSLLYECLQIFFFIALTLPRSTVY